MNEQKRAWNPADLLWLALGGILFIFVGWKWNMPLAAWLSPIFFIRFARRQDRWYKVLLVFPVMAIAGFINKTGAWDLDLLAEIGLCFLLPIPTVAALYADRFFTRRYPGVLATLAFPAVYTTLDFAFALPPLFGTMTSIAVTQFEQTSLIQLASVTGIWGIAFLIGWAASTFNTLWEGGFDVSKALRPAAIFSACFVLVLLFGGLRLSLARPSSETVRVGGVTVEHVRDYWGEIIDYGTPRELAHEYEEEIAALNEALFDQSDKAVQAGARIIFWSEGNAVVYEEQEAAFLERCRSFARENQVYFAPALLVLRYGAATVDNMLIMITPAGEIAYTYVKTISWYPSDSDGILHVVDTPYGRISAAICFDLDFPAFIRQAARQDVDIMLDPSFDSEGIKPYHSHVGLFRAVEDGFSMVKQTNAGTSMAVDYHGNILASQDFFHTSDRLMLADVPTRGVKTIYGLLGDWFAYLTVAGTALMFGWAAYKGVRR